MPISGRPKAKKNSTTVSGQFRITVTHAVPNQRNDGIGETRKEAITVPTIRAPTMPTGRCPVSGGTPTRRGRGCS